MRRPVALLLAMSLALTGGEAAAQRAKPKPKPKPHPTPEHPTPAHPTPAAEKPTSIAVTVVELAGTQAYVQPGTAGGVFRGARVTIGHKEYRVVQSTASFAAIDVTKDPPREHDKGVATVVSEDADKPAELPAPRPLATWEHAWAEAEAPAKAQTPKYVPLGGVERDRRWDVRLTAAGGAILPLGPGAGVSSASLNARVHAEPWASPLSFDLDITVQRWFASDIDARDGRGARPIVWLREALVGYGSGGWYAGFGRMRYAASTLGTLDGTRVRAPLGAGFSVGAFGGALPHPLSGEPSLSAQRFGVETTYSRPDVDLRPEAALVAHGSMFGGSLDERRLSGMFGLYPGQSRFGGHFEISSFDGNNPWKAAPIELTAGGVDASVRAGIFQFGGRFDVRQPVRSRWMASFLPTYWFCRTVANPAGVTTPEPCDGSVSTRALGSVDAGIEVGNVRVTVGGLTIGDLTQTDGAPDMKGVFTSGRVVRIAQIMRVDASASWSQGTFMNMYGGSAGPGISLLADTLDIGAYYRNATLEYRSVNTSLVQHGIGTTVMIFPSAELLFTTQGEMIAGSDMQALVVFGTAMWRPRF